LKQEDFELLDEGRAQQLTSFSVQKTGFAAVLLMDASGSMEPQLRQAQRAALEFVRQVGPDDLAMVMKFDGRVAPLGEFTSDHAALQQAIGQVTAGDTTALYDAVWTALAALQARDRQDESAKRRRAIIVLSDGEDTASALTADEVLAKARRFDATVSALSLDPAANGKRSASAPATMFLGSLADVTGGQLLFPGIGDLGDSYRDLAEELRQQYVLGYVPDESSGSRYRTITVRVKNRKNVHLRHRQGYFTNPTSSP
jgi:Ca-activated chloride channel family protein